MSKRRTFIAVLLILIVAQLFSACAAQSTSRVDTNNEAENQVDTNKESNEDNFYYSIVDALENSVVLEEKPSRVVSLVGSYAETWLLAGGELIGVTNDVMTERKLDLSEDTQIVGTIKDPDLEIILDLAPDFVLLSPDIESHVKAASTLEKANIPHGLRNK